MKNNKVRLFLVALVILYFATRLTNLKIIPIFTDEAIYSFWAQVALHDPANRFISLEDGKQPLFIWLAAISQKFVQDPLIASRLVSVFAGFGSLIGIYLLSKQLFDRKTAILASFLYIILPFTLLYDRMALFDSLLTMFGIYAVLFSVKMVKSPRLDTAILNGAAIGFAMITKSSGNFFLYLLPFSLINFKFKPKNSKLILAKWLGLSLLAVFISLAIYNALRLSPLFYLIARKNLEFIRSYSEVIANPLEHFLSNINALVGWVIAYIGLPLFIIFASGVLYAVVRRNTKVLYLLILVIVPFTSEAIFNKVLYPRFILFYFPYIVLTIAYFVVSVINDFKKSRNVLIFVFLSTLLMPGLTSFRLITNPTLAKIPQNDAYQYLNDWPAGYGVSEVVDFLKQQAKDQDIYVGTEGTFGLLPYALNIYFFGQNNVHIYSYWPVDVDKLPGEFMDLAKNGNKTYFIYYQSQKEITNPNLRLIAKYQKGIGQSFMRLYEVMSEK